MLDCLSLYRRHVKDLKRVGSGPEHIGKCPFPACMKKFGRKFYVNEETGQYDCKRCDASGNTITFAKYFNEDPNPYYDTPLLSAPSINFNTIDYWNRHLLDHPELWRKPWKRFTLEMLKVGWDDKLKTLTFPIFDPCGQIINFIAHKNSQVKGSKCTLYPAHLIENYDPSYLVLCEGMTDSISLLSIDIQVVTSTNGAFSIPKDLSILRRFKRIYLCFDVDEAGEAGCDRWINRLRSELSR